MDFFIFCYFPEGGHPVTLTELRYENAQNDQAAQIFDFKT